MSWSSPSFGGLSEEVAAKLRKGTFAREELGDTVVGAMQREGREHEEYLRQLERERNVDHNGLLGSGTAPIGLMRDETGDNLKPRPEHASQVDWLYKRFRELEASLSGLLRELIGMKDRGIPLFPYVDGIDEKSIQATRVEVGSKLVGWTIASRSGLISLLSNPQYLGHMVFEGRITKRDAFPAIVDEYAWWYAFEHLASVNLDGQPFERGPKTVRYTYPQSKITALLAGVRHDGRPVIDGVGGGHVYVTLVTGEKQFYTLVHHNGRVNAFETGVSVPELDRILTNHLLERLSLEEDAAYLASPASLAHTTGTIMGMDAREYIQQEAEIIGTKLSDAVLSMPDGTPVASQEDTTLEEVNQELARVQRALNTSQDVMSAERLRETFAKEAWLIKRRDELKRAIEHKARTQAQLEQARADVKGAYHKWKGWDLARRRGLIHLITDAITLEELAEGWLRLTVYWSSLVGGGVEHCYIWRSSGSMWSEEELEALRQQYPVSTRSELLHAFPKRSWMSIDRKERRIGLVGLPLADSPLPVDVSLTDVAIFSEYMLQPGKRVQWVTGQACYSDERS